MTNPLKNESRVRLAVLGGIAITAVVVACAVDAPVAPNAARAVSALRAVPEANAPRLGDRIGDTTRGWTVTRIAGDGKRVVSAWIRDSVGNRVEAEVLYDSAGGAREHDALPHQNLAVRRIEPNGPVVERGIVVPPGRRADEGPGKLGPQTRIISGSPLFEFQVEKTAAWIAGTGSPVYPPALKVAGIEGEVLASFVVDELGRVDPGSLELLKSTNSTFADAIRASLPNMRFTAAEVGGRKVSQHVQQSFRFSVK